MGRLKDILEQWRDAHVVSERRGEPIDMQWVNDERPMMTQDGRQVIIVEIDMEKVPNEIVGSVSQFGKLCDYRWSEDGTCVHATDRHNNPVKPTDKDNLVKAQ